MIFMKFFERSSRVTGPKMRLPIGSFCLVISTAALVSKRIRLPSGRRIGVAVRTITASGSRAGGCGVVGHDLPAFCLRQRPGLADAHAVADLALVALVVRRVL